ncbi:MAG: hypothetical protein MI919_34160, partial [Holophagales bacterium]|nr:hypothetical protein [Holophagales bacterium]
MLDVLRLLLVYAFATGLLLFAAHRFVRPLGLGAAVALLLLPMVSTGSGMLTGGFWGGLNLAYNSAPLDAGRDSLPVPEEGYRNGALMDQVSQVVPWRKSIRELVKTGHLPLMNRFVGAGSPLLAASQPAPLDPKVWLGFLLPLASAVTFACAFVLFQAALNTFLYLREVGVGEMGSIFGAAVWMMCGFLDFFVTWSLSSVVVTLPLLLLGLRRIALGASPGASRQRGLGVPIALIAWLLALAGGHPESVLHVTVVGGLFFLVHLRSSPNRVRAVA